MSLSDCRILEDLNDGDQNCGSHLTGQVTLVTCPQGAVLRIISKSFFQKPQSFPCADLRVCVCIIVPQVTFGRSAVVLYFNSIWPISPPIRVSLSKICSRRPAFSPKSVHGCHRSQRLRYPIRWWYARMLLVSVTRHVCAHCTRRGAAAQRSNCHFSARIFGFRCKMIFPPTSSRPGDFCARTQ